MDLGFFSRPYLEPIKEHEAVAHQAQPEWKPDVEFFQQALGFRIGNYEMTKWRNLFTDRQLVVLTTFSNLVGEAIEHINADSVLSGLPSEDTPLRNSGTGATAYAEAVEMYLGMALSRLTNICNSLCRWEVTKT